MVSSSIVNIGAPSKLFKNVWKIAFLLNIKSPLFFHSIITLALSTQYHFPAVVPEYTHNRTDLYQSEGQFALKTNLIPPSAIPSGWNEHKPL